MPKRIQLSRRKGWRKPEGAVVAARPSKWGNPFTVAWAMTRFEVSTEEQAQALAVGCHADWLTAGERSRWWTEEHRAAWEYQSTHLHELSGKDIGCWCSLRDPCHGNTLLFLANRVKV